MPRAGDQDAGLAGRAEVDVDAARREGARDGERTVFLAERAVGADGEQPLAGALAAGGDRDVGGRRADIDQTPAERAAAAFERAACR